jgi:hypothetical protein
MSDTISGALGIPEEWVPKNDKAVHEEITENETVSDAMLQAGKRVKFEEFGEGDYGNLTLFERKLLFMGFTICSALYKQRAEAAQHALLASLLEKAFTEKKSNDERGEE